LTSKNYLAKGTRIFPLPSGNFVEKRICETFY
jgi:hypothetical protein